MGVGISSDKSNAPADRPQRPGDRVDALVSLSLSQPEAAYALLGSYIETPEELVSYISRVKRHRGIGSGLKKALVDVLRLAPISWFEELSPIVSLDGEEWTWKSVLRLLHPKAQDVNESVRYAYMAGAIPQEGRASAIKLMEVTDVSRQPGHRSQRGALEDEVRSISSGAFGIPRRDNRVIVRAGGSDVDGDNSDA